MKVRKYKEYQEYLEHQKEKLNQPGYLEKRQNKRPHRIERFREKFEVLEQSFIQGRGALRDIVNCPDIIILCLAARLGEEVEAWKSLGYKAVGVDIEPGPDNKLVIVGDFHNLPFKSWTFDFIYSNSLDHCLDIEKLSAEMLRVLRPYGRVFLEIEPHKEGNIDSPNSYEAFHWDEEKELIEIFLRNGWAQVMTSDLPVFNKAKGEEVKRHHLILDKGDGHLEIPHLPGIHFPIEGLEN